MSDFLTNLVARSFAPAPNLLRPILPSLFEAPADNESAMEESLRMNTHEEIAEVAPVSSAANRSRLETRTASENDQHTSPLPEPSRELQEANRVARRTILPVVPGEPLRTPVKIQSEEDASAASTVKMENNLEEWSQPIGPHPEALVSSISKNDKAKLIEGRAPRFLPVIPRLELSRPLPPTKNNEDTQMLPFENQPPTVRINIGRIEVRAVMQSSPPARSVAPSRPKMTLDDYLLRRNEGK